MILSNKISLAGASALSVLAIACSGGENSAEKASESMPSAQSEAVGHDMHASAAMTSAHTGDTDHAAGVVVEVDLEGKRIKLDHEEMPNIGMRAMTMYFGAAGDVDLSEFETGDRVSFMVKRGRDGSYRIMAMCDMAADGAECLSGMMDHMEH